MGLNRQGKRNLSWAEIGFGILFMITEGLSLSLLVAHFTRRERIFNVPLFKEDCSILRSHVYKSGQMWSAEGACGVTLEGVTLLSCDFSKNNNHPTA